jgi:small-conductance mechanosensitive channel
MRRLGSLLAATVMLMSLAGVTTAAAQSAPSPQTGATRDLEADQPQASPVLVEGEPVLWITTGLGPYSAANRAERVARRLDEAIHDRSLRDPTVTIVDTEGSSELHAGPHLLMIITPRDAADIGAPRAALAQQYARMLETAIRDERLRYAPSSLVRSGIYGLLATAAYALVVWLIFRVTGAVRRRLAGRMIARSKTLRAVQAEMLSADRLSRALSTTVFLARVVLIVLALDVYLTFVLGLFPWTRAVSTRLLSYAFAPVRAVTLAVVGYLPKLLFLLVIGAVITLAIRVVGSFFRQISDGRLTFENFPAEWADPTNKIVRVLLIAFGLVVAFPYLPASDSPAFAGVSVFMGVLVSLASSSALSNMIAGIILTYTRAFKLGDRVKIGDAFGDITETSLLATRVRTIKNEEITIPNGLALATAVTNYTRDASTLGLILHTSVTIGYDAPWRQIHDLLIQAALATPGVLHDPKPFVWQTSLNDFYVTYEINAYTAAPKEMIEIYAVLHSKIQDSFYAAGVEIMSPHYTSVRDGNTIAIPEAQRPPGYQPGAFRVQASSADAARKP